MMALCDRPRPFTTRPGVSTMPRGLVQSPLQDVAASVRPSRGDSLSGHRRLRAAAAAAALLAPLSVVALGAPAQATGDAGRHHPHQRHERVGYFTQWGIYGAEFRVRNLVDNGTAARLTVLNYAFGNVNSSGQDAAST